MLILKQNQIHLSSCTEMNTSSPKCSIYSAVPHCCILSSWSRPPQHRDLQTTPECKHTPPERHNATAQPSPTYTHINSRHTNRRAGLFILSMLVQTGRNTFTSLCLTCSNTPFIQWLKVTSHREDKHQLTALIFIAKAVTFIQQECKAVFWLTAVLSLCHSLLIDLWENHSSSSCFAQSEHQNLQVCNSIRFRTFNKPLDTQNWLKKL